MNETPPSTFEKSGQIKFASFGRRVVATIIDELVFAPALLILFYSFGGAGSSSASALLFSSLITSVANLAYQIFFIFRYGQTLGNKATRTMVLNPQGEIPDLVSAIKRVLVLISSQLLNAVGASSFTVALTITDSLSMLVNRDRQTIHDRIAHTYVVILENKPSL
ncbi:MAG: RDD family protein [Actinomycetota bacterium]|nr:RDD family protein [Actinomycetota bacterium]